MDERLRDWMRNELDLEWSSATAKILNPTILSDLQIASKRIVMKEKMQKIDLNLKNNKLKKINEQKICEFSRKKFAIKKPNDTQAWNVYACLLEKFTDSEIFQEVLKLNPDELNIDNSIEKLTTTLKCWQEFHDDSQTQFPLLLNTSEESYENIKNKIPEELKRFAQSINSITLALSQPKEELILNTLSTQSNDEIIIQKRQQLISDLKEWSELFD